MMAEFQQSINNQTLTSHFYNALWMYVSLSSPSKAPNL